MTDHLFAEILHAVVHDLPHPDLKPPPGRHRKPALDPYAEIRPGEAAIASAMRRICSWCEDLHFRPYPEQPASSCNQVECECWCTTGTGQ